MSVFQLQEWWNVKLSEDEEFDHGCMVVGNIDNSNPSSEKIAVGSLQGVLRIYAPSHPIFKIEDLILEEVLNAPILQLLLGRFIPGSTLLGLAVLHPKQLVVYEVLPQSNKDGRVNFYILKKSYSHHLGIDGKHFTAYNMNTGSFGGVQDKDMIIIQSLDGKIQIFEQSASTINKHISYNLVPGPILYIPKIDSFVTVNHSNELECYRYHVLLSLQNEKKLKETETMKAGSTMMEWSLHLGETCRQILEGHFSTSTSTSGGSSPNPDSYGNNNKMKNKELLILCDKNIFLIKSETGALIQQKRLERSEASCMCVIPPSLGGGSSGGSSNNFIVAGQDATLQVFSGFNLVWAAKLPSVPVQMAVSSFGNQKGLIVCLDDEGRLSINYLGTKPPMSAVMQQVRELDYDLVESEHRSLLQIIRDSQSEQKVEVTDKLYIRPQLAKLIETDNPAGFTLPYNNFVSVFPNLSTSLHLDTQSNGPFIKICIRLYLSYSADKPATQVSVSIEAPSFCHIVPKNIILSTVSGVKTTPQMVKVYIYALKDKLPTTLEAVVTASYTSHLGEPRVSSIPLALPLFLACRPKPPVKSAQYKIVLDTETHPAQPLTELFGDLLYTYQSAGMEVAEVLGSGAAQAMGFQLFTALTDSVGLGLPPSTMHSGTGSQAAVVSILVSKNAGRYRIQADSYTAIAMVLEELEKRLHAHLTNTTATPSTDTVSVVKCADPLPLEQYFNTITAHFQTRQRIAQLSAQLNDAAHQYRMVEKRLLVRYKDRNPTPLTGLDSLMKETYDRLITLSDQMEEQQTILQRCMVEVDGHSRCIVTMAALKYGFTFGERQLLRAYLCPDLKEGTEQGWEETVNASATFLLKTALAKNAKDNSSSLTGTTLELPSAIETLQKHLLLLFDRLDKGGRLTLPNPSSPTPTTSPTTATSSAQSRSSKIVNNSRLEAK